MSGRWSRAVAGAALVAALPALSACNGGGDPESEGTPTPKFSEAPSESASGSASPSASGSAEPQTPEQVARAFVSGVGDAINSGDTNSFMQYATNDCSNCTVVARNIEQRYTKGRSARSTGWRVRKIETHQRTKNRVYYSGAFAAGSQDLLRRDGSVYKSEDAVTFDFEMRLDRSNGTWLVTGWDFA